MATRVATSHPFPERKDQISARRAVSLAPPPLAGDGGYGERFCRARLPCSLYENNDIVPLEAARHDGVARSIRSAL